MRHTPAPAALFTRNRDRLRALLPPGALCILHSNDLMPTNADGTMGFKQCTDLFYLTGIDQEETILVLFPDAARPEFREMLFVRETNDHIALWEGKKLDKAGATALSGIHEVRWSSSFPAILRTLMGQAGPVFLTTNEHSRAEIPVITRNDRFIHECRERFPLHDYRRLAPLIYPLRMIKQPEEIAMLETACARTASGFDRVLRTIRPGMGEWELEAELLHEFVRLGSRGFAYPPIIGAAGNACILHYVDNNTRVQDGDLVLFDVAAENGNWNADLTRTIPANGRFSDRQRAVYSAVLRILRHAESITRPGIRPSEYQRAVIEYTEGELIGLGLIDAEAAKSQPKDKPLVKKYLPHGVSHHLGLDVHDVNIDETPLAPGHVLTIEPGIYIPEENLGVRLENDYLVTEDKPVNLLAAAPIEIEEIEAIMAAR